MSVAIIGAVVGVGTAAYGIISGASQKKKAKRQLAELNANQPIEKVPEEILQNKELASLRAKTGLPSEQYAQAMKNIQRQQMRTLRGATDRKMGLSLLSTVDDNANTAIGNLDVANAKARMQNEKTLMETNSQIGNWKKGIYDRNVRQVYDRNYDYSMGLLGSGNQNISNGITSGINALGSVASGIAKGNGSNTSWASGLFGRRKHPRLLGSGNEGYSQGQAY